MRLYDPDLREYPDPGYEHIGPVAATRLAGTPREELLMALRREAGRQGADAVILQRIREAIRDPDGVAETVVVAEGLAIFWP